jgi:hypothetical protein
MVTNEWRFHAIHNPLKCDSLQGTVHLVWISLLNRTRRRTNSDLRNVCQPTKHVTLSELIENHEDSVSVTSMIT